MCIQNLQFHATKCQAAFIWTEKMNRWISTNVCTNGKGGLASDRITLYTMSMRCAWLCENSTYSIFPSLVCRVRASSIWIPLTGSQRGSTLTRLSPCERLYKKFPVVTFVSWKLVLMSFKPGFFSFFFLEQAWHLLVDLSTVQEFITVHIRGVKHRLSVRIWVINSTLSKYILPVWIMNYNSLRHFPWPPTTSNHLWPLH